MSFAALCQQQLTNIWFENNAQNHIACHEVEQIDQYTIQLNVLNNTIQHPIAQHYLIKALQRVLQAEQPNQKSIDAVKEQQLSRSQLRWHIQALTHCESVLITENQSREIALPQQVKSLGENFTLGAQAHDYQYGIDITLRLNSLKNWRDGKTKWLIKKLQQRINPLFDIRIVLELNTPRKTRLMKWRLGEANLMTEN